MLYHVSLLGVLVALMLFSLSINCEQHISLFIIHEHILTFLLADTCESCLTGYIWKHCLLQTQNKNPWPFVIYHGTSETEPDV